jgi:hypothetical protein
MRLLNRREAVSAARQSWQSRNRTARSVWGARSLLPLFGQPAASDSASKLDALYTLREIRYPQTAAQPADDLDY